MREAEKMRLQEIAEAIRRALDSPRVPKSIREAVLEHVEEIEELIENGGEDEGEDIEDFIQ